MSIQKINVKNTYVATVKSDVANRAVSFYVNNNEKENIFSETSVFPEVGNFNNSSEPLKDINLNEVISENKEITIPEELNVNNNPSVSSNEIVNNSEEVTVNVPSNTIQDIPNLNVLEANVEPNQPVNPMPMPNIPETVIHPEPIPNPVDVKVEPTPAVDNFTNIEQMVNQATVNNSVTNGSEPVRFDASHETNLLGALGDDSGQKSIGNINVTPDNLNVVREFGVDEPIVNNPNVATTINSTSGGFVNSKVLLVVVVLLFLASCVFLGYEIYNYFILSK